VIPRSARVRRARCRALAVAALLAGSCASPASVPAPIGDAPRFSLVDQHGRARTLEQLAGRVWVADFIFTRCPGPCPILTRRMARLRARLPRSLGAVMVSFTVDPEHDSPAAMAAYARERGISGDDWWFLTGPPRTLREVVVDGFRLPVTSAPAGDARGPLLHSNRFVLVDGRGRIRGYYDGDDDAALERLARDAGAIGAEPAPRRGSRAGDERGLP